jgi:hypothetical protein
MFKQESVLQETICYLQNSNFLSASGNLTWLAAKDAVNEGLNWENHRTKQWIFPQPTDDYQKVKGGINSCSLVVYGG